MTEIRVELEGLAAAFAAERATEEDRATLLQLLHDLEQGSHERADHTELDARVHRAIYAAARNEYLETTLNQYSNLALRIWNFCLQENLAVDNAIHSQREVVEAIVRGRPARRAGGRRTAPPGVRPRGAFDGPRQPRLNLTAPRCASRAWCGSSRPARRSTGRGRSRSP